MANTRKEALSAISIGDVVYGVSGKGNEKLLLVYARTERGFLARHVTSQTWAEFGPNGVTFPAPEGGNCTIVSTAPLPANDYATAIGLDRKMRTGKAYPDFVLSRAEIDLINNCGAYFRAHLLPAD